MCCRGNCVLTVQSNVCMKVVRSIVELGRGGRGGGGGGRGRGGGGERGRGEGGGGEEEGGRGGEEEERKWKGDKGGRQEKQKGKRVSGIERGRRGNNVQNSVITSREMLKQKTGYNTFILRFLYPKIASLQNIVRIRIILLLIIGTGGDRKLTFHQRLGV